MANTAAGFMHLIGKAIRSVHLLVMMATAAAASPQPSVADLPIAYPDAIAGINGNELIWRDGTRMPISDGISPKGFKTLLDHPDIDDMFAIPYRPGKPTFPPGVNDDPGRVLYEPLFIKLYGDCRKGEVEPRLTTVAWLAGTVRFTTANGAAEHLAAVVSDLKKLPAAYAKYLVPSAGTYNCRTIAGTDRRSMHAYGAAIDINTAFADYWGWVGGSGHVPYRDRIPFEIAAIFEHHGFIWGAKWYHFDTMHFEYRPELLPDSQP
jgi:hypothetical protein